MALLSRDCSITRELIHLFSEQSHELQAPRVSTHEGRKDSEKNTLLTLDDSAEFASLLVHGSRQTIWSYGVSEQVKSHS